eukprot:6346707-Amphidinium_carterae.5
MKQLGRRGVTHWTFAQVARRTQSMPLDHRQPQRALALKTTLETAVWLTGTRMKLFPLCLLLQALDT